MKSRFTKDSLNKVYNHYMEREDLTEVKRRGSTMSCAFMDGYDGVKNYRYLRGSLVYAAYVAGKERKKREVKEQKSA